MGDYKLRSSNMVSPKGKGFDLYDYIIGPSASDFIQECKEHEYKLLNLKYKYRNLYRGVKVVEKDERTANMDNEGKAKLEERRKANEELRDQVRKLYKDLTALGTFYTKSERITMGLILHSTELTKVESAAEAAPSDTDSSSAGSSSQ